MNKIIQYNQCTTLWHVDDLKTSHVDPAIISSVLADIYAEYRKISKMTITRGKLNKYLRMTIDYSSPGKIILSMIYHIGNMLDDITEYMKGVLVSPTAHHPFNIAEDVTKLSQVDSDIFHHFLAQLLYLSKRALTDIQLGVSFLFISVRGPDTAE